jgi:hypothetical protein
MECSPTAQNLVLKYHDWQQYRKSHKIVSKNTKLLLGNLSNPAFIVCVEEGGDDFAEVRDAR